MTAPAKPVQLLPTSTYIHISSNLDPKAIQSQAAAQSVHIEHKGPVGELEGDHIFEVLDEGRAPVASDSVVVRDVAESAVLKLRGTDGVKTATVMETRQRAKR
jgi:hypothetical protein